MHEYQENIIKNALLYLELSAFSKVVIYKLHLVELYAVNDYKFFYIQIRIHGIKISLWEIK